MIIAKPNTPSTSTATQSLFDSINRSIANLSIMAFPFLKNLVQLCFPGAGEDPPPYTNVEQGAWQHFVPAEPKDSYKIIQEMSSRLADMEARLRELESPKARDATLALQYQMLTI